MEEEKKKGKEKQQRNVSIENTFVTVSSSFECKMCTDKNTIMLDVFNIEMLIFSKYN